MLAGVDWWRIGITVVACVGVTLVSWVWYRLHARKWLRGPLGVVRQLGLSEHVRVGIDTVKLLATGAVDRTPARVNVRLTRDTRRSGMFTPGEGYKPQMEFHYEIFAQLPPTGIGHAPASVGEAATVAGAAEDVRGRRKDFPREINSNDFIVEDGWVGFRLTSKTQYRGDKWLETAVRSVVDIANHLGQ